MRQVRVKAITPLGEFHGEWKELPEDKSLEDVKEALTLGSDLQYLYIERGGSTFYIQSECAKNSIFELETRVRYG